MTDEVFSDNLDEAPEADLEAVAAVEALPAEGESVQETADETVEAEPTAEVVSDESEEGKEDDEQDAGAKAVEDFSNSLRTLEGKWYVLHTYSGYEKRVKTNVESRVASFGMEDKIFQIEVPMEEVEKHTEKGKKVITRVRVPGYVLIRMLPDESASSKSPTPLAIRSPSPTVRSPPWQLSSPTLSPPHRNSPCSCPSSVATHQWSWASIR